MSSGERQSGRRRGPYKRRTDPLLDAGTAAYLARIDELAETYARPLLDKLAKVATKHSDAERYMLGVRSAARHLAQLEVSHQIMSERQARQTLTSDEVRTLAGLSREIRLVRAELGLPLPPDKHGAIDVGDDDLDDYGDDDV